MSWLSTGVLAFSIIYKSEKMLKKTPEAFELIESFNTLEEYE